MAVEGFRQLCSIYIIMDTDCSSYEWNGYNEKKNNYAVTQAMTEVVNFSLKIANMNKLLLSPRQFSG